jgi:hypothetical protein
MSGSKAVARLLLLQNSRISDPQHHYAWDPWLTRREATNPLEQTRSVDRPRRGRSLCSMRILGYSIGSVVFIAAIASFIALCLMPAAADDMQMTTCPSFTGTTWANPMPPSNSGNRYTLTLNKHEMSCAQAESWAKKLIVQHIPGKPMMPQYPPLRVTFALDLPTILATPIGDTARK